MTSALLTGALGRPFQLSPRGKRDVAGTGPPAEKRPNHPSGKLPPALAGLVRFTNHVAVDVAFSLRRQWRLKNVGMNAWTIPH